MKLWKISVKLHEDKWTDDDTIGQWTLVAVKFTSKPAGQHWKTDFDQGGFDTLDETAWHPAERNTSRFVHSTITILRQQSAALFLRFR